jgi:hypothetical protein
VFACRSTRVGVLLVVSCMYSTRVVFTVLATCRVSDKVYWKKYSIAIKVREPDHLVTG